MATLEGKVALVTGASHPKGIGCAIAKKLAELGASVIVTDLEQTRDQLETVAAEIEATGGGAMALAVDVTSEDQAAHCVIQIMEKYGRLDILVNNAGLGGGSSQFLEMRKQDLDLAYRVNVGGIVTMCQASIPQMLEQGGGRWD